MAEIDIFNDDAFGLVELTAALEEVEYMPQWLGQIGIFESRSARTVSVAIEKREDELRLIQTTPRGSPPIPQNQKPRDIRDFRGVRVANDDTLLASELQGIRAFGSETEFEQVQTEVLRRQVQLRNDQELTHEHLRLGAIQGIVYDADGTTVLHNWFTNWGIAQPAEIVFDFATLIDGKLRQKTNEIARLMARNGKGAFLQQTQIWALAGDQFYDALVAAPEVRESYKNWQAAVELRGNSGGILLPWDVFYWGGIYWQNYRGTDDGSKVAISPKEVKFFPRGSPGTFLRVNTPGESFDAVNQPGREFYANTIPDRDRDQWVKMELYSYPLYICTRPRMLLRGKIN